MSGPSGDPSAIGVGGGSRVSQRRRSLGVGVYAWMTAVAFGMVLIDVSYAANLPAAQGAGALAEVRDFLLTFGAMTVVVGVGAVAGAWPSGSARYALLASLALIVAELSAPALISQPILDAESATGIHFGAWIRIGVSASASAAAFIGFWVSSRAYGSDLGQRPSP